MIYALICGVLTTIIIELTIFNLKRRDKSSHLKWVDINSRVPTIECSYLTYRKYSNYSQCNVSIWVNNGMHPSETGWSNVTHWMELPKKPKEL